MICIMMSRNVLIFSNTISLHTLMMGWWHWKWK